MNTVTSIASRVNSPTAQQAQARVLASEHSRLTALADSELAREHCAAYIAAESTAEYLFARPADELRGSFGYRVSRGALAFVRSVFQPWRQAASKVAIVALEEYLSREMGFASQSFRQLSPEARHVMAARAWAIAKAAHDLTLEGHLGPSSGEMARIAEAIEAEQRINL